MKNPEIEKEKQASTCGTINMHLFFVKWVYNFEMILVSLSATKDVTQLSCNLENLLLQVLLHTKIFLKNKSGHVK